MKPRVNLFSRVVQIIESARGAVVKSVNSEMVGAYWLIGKKIIEEEQKGQQRADYGERIIEKIGR